MGCSFGLNPHGWLLLCTLPLLGLGCTKPASVNSGGTHAAASASSTDGAPAPVAGELLAVSWEDVQQRLGRISEPVVLVNIWTTTCPVCLEHMPRLVELCQQRTGKVYCIQVNCDYDGVPSKPVEFYLKGATAALQARGAQGVENLENVMMNVAFLDFLNQINLNSTPAVLVYDQQRKLVKRFDNDESSASETDFRSADVADFVDALAQQSPTGP